MPASYHVTPANLWASKSFQRLSHAAKLVAFYVFTAPTRTAEGLFALNANHAAADVGLDVDDVLSAFAELDHAGYVSYDVESGVVLDRLALRTQPLKHREDNRIKSATRLFGAVPDCPLKVEFVRVADRESPALAEAICVEYGIDPYHDREAPIAPQAPSGGGGASSAVQSRASEELSSDVESSDDLAFLGNGKRCEYVYAGNRCPKRATTVDGEFRDVCASHVTEVAS